VVSLRALIADLVDENPRPDVGAALAACPPGGVVAAREAGADVAVVRFADGRAFVVADACPHDGGPLSDGFVDGDRLVCARHGWEVDPCQGTCGRARIASRALPDPFLDRLPTSR
jgi:phenylpropionate dioxygenase-like ring-hydroxylating dioxygenase large terminal subunit